MSIILGMWEEFVFEYVQNLLHVIDVNVYWHATELCTKPTDTDITTVPSIKTILKYSISLKILRKSKKYNAVMCKNVILLLAKLIIKTPTIMS